MKVNKKLVVVASVVCLLFTTSGIRAQETLEGPLPAISLEQAVSIAKENYPLLKTSRLEIDKQTALKANAYDFGDTKVYTGGEELMDGEGVYTTIGVGQQNIDLFGIGAKKRLQKQRIALAETAYNLSQLQVVQQVKDAWSGAFQAKQKMLLYEELDSIYSKFAIAIELNLEVEAISRLEYASATNQALQINNKYRQAVSDYDISLQRLNLWLVSETVYTVPNELVESELTVLGSSFQLKEHPEFMLSQKRLSEAEADYKAARADRLPKFNLQGALQKVDGTSGFYTYQGGISVPLFYGPGRGRAKAAKMERTIAETNTAFKQEQLRSAYGQALQSHEKWRDSWHFYRDQALPLAAEQRKGALFAYSEGAVDYAAFTQIIRDAIQTEIDALDALDNYLKSVFKLQYYTL